MSEDITIEADNTPFMSVKLVSGEELLVLWGEEDDTEYEFVFYDPYLILKFYSQDGYDFSIVDYLVHSQDTVAIIPKDMVVCMSPMSDSAYDLYYGVLTRETTEMLSDNGKPRLRIVKNDKDKEETEDTE